MGAKQMHRIYTQEEDNYICEHYNAKPAKHLAQKLDRTCGAITARASFLRRKGYVFVNPPRLRPRGREKPVKLHPLDVAAIAAKAAGTTYGKKEAADYAARKKKGE